MKLLGYGYRYGNNRIGLSRQSENYIIRPFFNGMVWDDDPYGITGGPNVVADWNGVLQPGHADQPSIPGMRYATTVEEGAIAEEMHPAIEDGLWMQTVDGIWTIADGQFIVTDASEASDIYPVAQGINRLLGYTGEQCVTTVVVESITGLAKCYAPDKVSYTLVQGVNTFEGTADTIAYNFLRAYAGSSVVISSYSTKIVTPQWVPEVGPELVTNGGFDSDTSWTKGTGWTIADGVATHTGSDSNLSQDMGLESGKTYLVGWDADCNGGTAGIDSSCYSSAMGDNDKTEDGTYATLIVSNGSDFAAYCDGDASLDNISVREVPPNYAPWKVDAQGNPDYTTTDSTSVVPYDLLRGKQVPNNMEYRYFAARTNRLLSSNDQTNAAWTKRGAASATKDLTSPKNVANAACTVSVGASGVDDLYQVITGYTASAALANGIWIKQITTSGTLTIADPAGTNGEWSVDLSKLNGQWERITAEHPAVTVVTAFTADGSGQCGLCFYGSATISFGLYNCLQQEGELAWDIETTDATVTMPAGVYSRVNPLACKGVLVEPVRTNKCTCVKANPTDTTNVTVDNIENVSVTVVDDVDELVAAGYSETCQGNVYRATWVAAGTVYIDGASGNLNPHSCALTCRVENITGSAIQVGLGSSTRPTIESAAYQRIVQENETPSGINKGLLLYKPDGTGSCYFILPQLEEGSFCTSPIWRASDYTEPATSITRPANVIEALSAGILRGDDIGLFFQVMPSVTGQSGVYLLSTYVDGNNFTYVSITATSIGITRRVSGAYLSAYVSYIHKTATPFQVQTYMSSVDGLGIRVREWLGLVWGAWTAWETNSNTAGLAIDTTFNVMGEGATNNMAGNCSFCIPIWHSDPKTYLENMELAQ